MNKRAKTNESLKFWNPASAFQNRHYLSLEALKEAVAEYHCSPQTLTRYIVEWKKSGKIFSAGRSWYSDLGNEFRLDPEPLRQLSAYLEKQFPLLEFSCWSTRQISDWHQHLPLRYFTFIYVDRYAISDVADSLKEAYPDIPVIKNPSRKEAESLERREANIIIRPILYDDRMEQSTHFLSIEKILADYAIEAENLLLTDGAEYSMLFESITTIGRINISALLRRISHRKNKNQNVRMIFNQLM